MAEFSEHDLKSLLRNRTLSICQGIDGRAVPPEVLGRLSELVDIAGALGLEDDRARLSKLLAICRRGYVGDLTRAALACLTEDIE